jgi:uncharacterized GH25 family protein
MKKHLSFCRRLMFAISVPLLIVFVMAGPAMAHFPWINLSDYTQDAGANMKVTIAYGHHYPLDGFLHKDGVESVTLIGPGKDTPKITYTSDLELQSEEALSREGAYLVTAQQKSGYYTKTTHGAKKTSKKGLDGVIRCSRSHKCMKAIANVGKKGGPVDMEVGQSLEIIPLKNPIDLKAGDYMPIRVIADGKPFSGDVLATYAGFSTDKNTFAYATKTDIEGRGRIRILQPGIWLVKVQREVPYPDASECDVESYVGTLTFSVE